MTVSYVAVMPSIWPPYTDAAMAACHLDVEVIDNTETNRGVAASWNIGARRALAEGADWLIVMSAAMRFGNPGGLDFLDHLDAMSHAAVVEAADGIGWHLIAFHTRTLAAVGLFDENFHPAYWEDIDWSYRFRLTYTSPPYVGQVQEPFWPKVPTDAWVASVGHGTNRAKVSINDNRLIGYYVRKWGGMTGMERYRTPFNEPHPVTWWPDPAEDR